MFFPTKKIILFPSCFLSFFLFFCFPSLSSYVSGEVARHTGKSAFNFGVVQPIHRPLLIIHICVAGTVSRAEGAGVLSCFSCVWLFVTPWTAAHQAPLSMGFSRQECWNGLPFPPPGNLPDLTWGLNPHLLCLLHWQVGLLLLASPEKPWGYISKLYNIGPDGDSIQVTEDIIWCQNSSFLISKVEFF